MNPKRRETTMPTFPSTAVILTIAALALSGCATDQLAEHALNAKTDGWYTWGNVTSEVVQDASAPGGKFQRITVATRPPLPWDEGVVATVDKPVKKGDVIVFAFWARAELLPEGDDFIQLSGRVTGKGPPPNGLTPETSFLLSRQWQLFHSTGTAEGDFAAGAAGGSIVVGGNVQTIDFAAVYISDFGPNFDVSKLRQLKTQDK